MVLAYEGLPLLLCYGNPIPTSLSYNSLLQTPINGNISFYLLNSKMVPFSNFIKNSRAVHGLLYFLHRLKQGKMRLVLFLTLWSLVLNEITMAG